MKFTLTAMKERIRSIFLNSGFDLLGFAAAQPLEEEKLNFSNWLRRHYHGEMEWLHRTMEKRLNPGLVLPSVRTVIVAGVNYYKKIHRDPDSAWISRYALGDDYHEILKNMLMTTWKNVREELSFSDEYKIYVDTGPVYEKIWAQRAGIGWIGKNGCVISPAYGSFFFVGVILSTVSLPPDSPYPDRCGRCGRCLKSCPTGALSAPYVMDARKCISYLTIEHKGEIPDEFENKFGKWIFGCDICQEVCPWNRKFARPGKISAFNPRQEIINRRAAAWLGSSEEDFRRLFKRSPVKRLTYKRFLRNVRFIAKGV